MDDFIGVVQASHIKALRHTLQAFLHGIHSIFPPLSVFGHVGGDPISYKKLFVGDRVWAVQKEILGWVFDGLALTLELPEDKLCTLLLHTKQTYKPETSTIKNLQKLLG